MREKIYVYLEKINKLLPTSFLCQHFLVRAYRSYECFLEHIIKL